MVHNIHVSLVIFTIKDNALCVWIHDDKLPSAPLAYDQTLDRLVSALSLDTFGKKIPAYIEQLYTTADPIEQGSIVVVYLGLVPLRSIPVSKRSDVRLVSKCRHTLAESKIISYAIQRLRWKVEYTNAVYSLLPELFTLSELQMVYEAILGKKLDKRNFRKKILALKILIDTGKKKALGRARPAEVFTFKDRKLTIVEIL